MFTSFSKTMESPCRTCENAHLNKDICSKDCIKLQAFQDAIVRSEEYYIKEFGLKYDPSKL
jgi:hypothetical protein